MKSYNVFTIKALLFLLAFLLAAPVFSQQTENQKKLPTKDEIMEMSYQDLLNMPFEQLIQLANIVGVSAEDLLQMIMNKEVSSASKTKEKVMQSPLSTTVISKEELVASGATNIAEALRMVPGMIVREKTPGNFDLHIRGNDNTPPKNVFVYSEDAMSLVMIDNRPVFNYSFGGTFWETLPIDINDVERIEVIRGPSSALYGPNAVAGVINIITKHPDLKKLTANASVQMGNLNTKIANADVSGGIGKKLKYRVSGNYQYMERFDDKFYVFDLDQYLTYDQMDTLHNYWAAKTNPPLSKELAENHFKDKIINKNLATDKYAGNIFLYYDVNKEVNFGLTAGMQQSDVVSTTLGTHAMPIIGRKSNTQYVDLRAKAYGFEFQTNYLTGDQEVEQGNPGWHIAPNIFNTQLEYEYRTDKLALRPGVSYQSTLYTDKEYVDVDAKGGFLNGDKKLSSVAAFMRVDYKPIDKLRLIAALRMDKYDIPDKTYLTYQLIGTYSFNENNVVRGVYSRANRGPFIVDSHADLNSTTTGPQRAGDPDYSKAIWSGNQNLKLPVMDMFEIGYRIRPFEKMMIDLEAFHTETKDFSYFVVDSMVLSAKLNRARTAPYPRSAAIVSTIAEIKYYNFDMRTTQDGITLNITAFISNKLNFRVFGTVQQTKIFDFYPRTINNSISWLSARNMALMNADVNAYRLGTIPVGDSIKRYVSGNFITKDSLTNVSNNSTPSIMGGITIDYRPTKRLGIFATAYFYGDQTIETITVDKSNSKDAQDTYKVMAKIIPTLKVTYKIWKENTIFFNARNILGNIHKEFAYTDQVKSMYLVGLELHF
jgi:iron complex outermembrane receptor protein